MIPTLKIFTEKEKKELIEKLEEQFGIKEIQGLVTMFGAERMFLFQGNMGAKEIQELQNLIYLERVGIYFAKEQNDQIRLSMEGVYVLKNQITKNIFELNKEQAEEWMLGQELPIKTGTKEFLVMKYGEYFLGCGKASEEKIGNFIPKNRRLKYKESG